MQQAPNVAGVGVFGRGALRVEGFNLCDDEPRDSFEVCHSSPLELNDSGDRASGEGENNGETRGANHTADCNRQQFKRMIHGYRFPIAALIAVLLVSYTLASDRGQPAYDPSLKS
jgi:hypothetical protein